MIIVDSSYWLGLLDIRDDYHTACTKMEMYKTTSAIHSEL